MIQKILAALLVLGGVALAVFVFVTLFIGGVEQIVDGVEADPTDGSDIAWGALKILVSTTAAAFSFWACAAGAMALWVWGDD